MIVARIAGCLALCLTGGVLSLILLGNHYGIALLGEAALAVCGEGGGCDVVSQSRFATFLGVSLAAWGLFFYGALFALLAPSLTARIEDGHDPARSFAFWLVALSLVIDVVLFGLQLAVIGAFCSFCIATYVVNLLLLAVLWPFRQFSLALNFLFTPAARRPLVSWAVASFFVGAAAVAIDSGLADRKALAASNILGIPMPVETSPAPPSSTAAPATGSVEEQLAEARAEAKRWKDTLDDGRRLQIYLNQKSRDDFNNAPVSKVDASRSPFMGPADAPITVVSYSDFMCPFCRDLATGLKNYLPASGNQVKSVYKHFPLDKTCNPSLGSSLHPGSCELSRGGICAEESGRFWEFHDLVFAERWDRATREDVLRIGVAAGLDRGKLGACMDSAATKGRLARDVEEGARVGVTSTPTILVNGRRLGNTGSFLIAMDEERKRLKLPSTSAAAREDK